MSDPCRLYLLTPPTIADLAAFAHTLEAALGAGDVACLQLRLKDADDAAIMQAAATLLPIARVRDVVFLVNDRMDLAKQAGTDGVHLGQEDGTVAAARSLLGKDAVIGVTCHASKDLAIEAGDCGADYVAFGAFFASKTKEATVKCPIDVLQWWNYATTVPSVAIGGITPENCAPLVRAGADFLAVSSAVWDHVDGAAAAVRQFHAAIAGAAQ